MSEQNKHELVRRWANGMVLTATAPADKHALKQFVQAYDALLTQAEAMKKVLEYIKNDMPKKAKEKFERNEVTYLSKITNLEVLNPRFEHAIICRDVLANVKASGVL
jgi:uncharacterized protein Yka (UPF0111/DUF47 family)